MIVLETSVEMKTARVPVFDRVVLEILYSGVSTLDGIGRRTLGLPFPEKSLSYRPGQLR